MRNIRQNLFAAFVYKVVGLSVAAGVLYPVFGILLSPMIAGAAMNLSSVSVIGKALHLRTTLVIGMMASCANFLGNWLPTKSSPGNASFSVVGKEDVMKASPSRAVGAIR